MSEKQKWKVGGWNLYRRQFVQIVDEVEASSIEKAMKKARTRYKNAPELNVTGIPYETQS